MHYYHYIVAALPPTVHPPAPIVMRPPPTPPSRGTPRQDGRLHIHGLQTPVVPVRRSARRAIVPVRHVRSPVQASAHRHHVRRRAAPVNQTVGERRPLLRRCLGRRHRAREVPVRVSVSDGSAGRRR